MTSADDATGKAETLGGKAIAGPFDVFATAAPIEYPFTLGELIVTGPRSYVVTASDATTIPIRQPVVTFW